MRRVTVTCKWPDAVQELVARDFDATFIPDGTVLATSDLVRLLRTEDALLATVTDRLTREMFESGGLKTKMIANFGVGYSHIDVSAASENGIIVSNTPGVLTDCTADTALTLMLMAARRAGEGERMLRAGQWKGFGPTFFLGTRLTGKRLGIIGMGRIGQATAHRAHYGFGMDVVYHNRSPVADAELKAMGAQQLPIVQVLARSDFVSLHCPGGPENRHIINRERLSMMQPSAFLINTARGEVVDETALIEALQNGVIAGAGLDVYENEPDINPGLLGAPNTVLLPHVGSATHETRIAMGMKALENLVAFAQGCPVPDRVN